ncbi:hypothetical protein JCM8547_005767 [Rhodosporidiobolus lusitaniae]
MDSDGSSDYGDSDSLWDSLPPELLSQLDSAPATQHHARAAQGEQQQQQQQYSALPRASQILPKRVGAPQPSRPQPPPPRFPAAPPTQITSTALPPPPPHPLLGTARPSGILRPAQPPPRKKPRLAVPPVQHASPALTPAPTVPGGVQGAGGGKGAEEKRRNPRASLNEKGEVGFVDPNPWAGKVLPPPPLAPLSPGAPQAGRAQARAGGGRRREVEEEEEEDLPAIEIDEQAGGYRAEPQRGTTVVRREPVPPAGLGEAVGGRVRGGMRAGSVVPPPPVLTAGAAEGGSGLSEEEKRELRELRAEKAKLQAALLASQMTQEQLQRDVATKMGENKIVRGKLSKAEAAHAAALKQEKRDKQQLQDQLEQKEKDYKAAVERMKIKEAFRRQELSTSSAHRPRPSSSQRPTQGIGAPGFSSSTSQRFYARTASAAPVSPLSVSRTGNGRAASARLSPGKPPAQPNFGAGGSGFNASSAAPPGGAREKDKFEGRDGAAGFTASQKRPLQQQQQKQLEREGSMGPPKQKRVAVGGKDPGGKGKLKAAAREEDEAFFGPAGAGGEEEYGGGEDAPLFDVGGADEMLQGIEQEKEDEDDPFPWEWIPDQRDEHAELLAAVFAHTTLAPFDVEVAPLLNPPPSAHPHQRGASARLSFGVVVSSARQHHLASTAAGGTGMSRSFSTSSHHLPPPAPPPQPSGPFPTLHALFNLRFPSTVDPTLVQQYELTSRSLFTLLGRPHCSSSSSSSSPHHLPFPPPPSEDPLPRALAAHGATLLLLLDSARLASPMTALLRLFGTLVFLFPEFAEACATACGEVAIPSPAGKDDGKGKGREGGAKDKKEKKPQQKVERTSLLPLLARIIARYGRPEPPSSSSGANGKLGTSLSTARPSALVPRSRKARLVRPNQNNSSSSSLRGAAAKPAQTDGVERVVLEQKKREKLVEACLGVVEGMAWRVAAWGEEHKGGLRGEGEGGRKEREREEGMRFAEEGFIAFVQAPCTVATMLDPNQPVGLLLSALRVLTLFACRPTLFRPLLGTKFYDAPDTRTSKLPLVDRVASLLAVPRSESLSSHHLTLSLLSLSLRLLIKHEDALMLVTQSATFVPEVVGKMWREVREVWEWDGRELGGVAGEGLRRTTIRLSSLVHLLYYLAYAPHSSLTIRDLLHGPSDEHQANAFHTQSVADVFMAALGTLAFATLGGGERGQQEKEEDEEDGAMPSWCMAEGWEAERRRLVELGYLAQELLEDVSPDELEEIEVCFGPPDAYESDDEGEEAQVEGEEGGEGVRDGGHGDVGDETRTDEEGMMLDVEEVLEVREEKRV